MSEFFVNTIGGGGGGGTVNSLTPDTGAAVPAVAGTIPTLGFKAGTVPTMQTYNDGAGNFRIADQSWQTQYVVDPSVVPGLKGTFQTIQAAITQAEADGAAFGTNAVIYIRSPAGVTATYAEDLVINGGIILVGQAGFGPNGLLVYSPLIVGNHTFGNLAALQANNVAFQNDATGNLTTFTSTGAQTLFSLELLDCQLINNQGPTGGFVNSDAGFNQIFLKGCFCDTGGEINAFVMPGIALSTIRDTIFAGAGWTISGGAVEFYNCINIGPVVLSNANIVAYNSSFFADTTDNITGTGSANTLVNCVFASNSSSTAACSSTGGLQGWANSIGSGSTGPKTIFSASLPVNNSPAMAGCIWPGVSSAVNYIASQSDFYIGITDTSAPRTVTLPNPTTIAVGHIFSIKDESGNADINAISVTPAGGALIDGLASYLVQTVFGAVILRSNGTNYFTLAING